MAAVILAAGASQRMGRPKLLLPWDGTTVLGQLLRQWQPAHQIGVVTAASNNALLAELKHCGFPSSGVILNPSPERGMFSSIQCAAAWSGWRNDITHWAIVLGDQPHLRPTTLESLRQFAAAHPEQVCQPARSGHHRHPVILPKNIFLQLPDSKAPHLKAFLESLPEKPVLCEINDPGLELDIDRPKDYQKALSLWHLACSKSY